MAAAGRVSSLAVLLSLTLLAAAEHPGEEVETCHASAGHLFALRCHVAGAHANVTWGRGARRRQGLPAGVEVRDGLLWFLPVRRSHGGLYICEKRDETGRRMTFRLSVSAEKCPDAVESRSIPAGVYGGLPCKQSEILSLNGTRDIRWMKDCHPVEREEYSIYEDGFMGLPAVAEGDAGKYTCLVDVVVDGRTYTSARSIQLTVTDGAASEIFAEPRVVSPQHLVLTVEVGARAELTCLAYIGFSEDSEVLTYWTVDSVHADDYEELNESRRWVHDGGKVFCLVTLSISEVLPRFLNVPFCCHILSPADEKVGFARLQEADHSAFHNCVALGLTASLTALALAAVFALFKVDLALAHRELLRRVAKRRPPEGKLYDAYLSFSQQDASAEVEAFALQILPEELEERRGYSLYIGRRDGCPGEATCDAVAATLRQCRRLIVILSPDAKGGAKERELWRDYRQQQLQLCYEQTLGLHDALIQNDPKVILVEIGGPVDYGRLPESLRYIKRIQGSLTWRQPSKGSHGLTRLCSNRTFWKKLRYHMPSVPTGRRRDRLLSPATDCHSC